MQPLLGHDAREKEDVIVHPEAVLFFDDLGGTQFGRPDTVGDVLGRAVIHLAEVRLVVAGEHDDLIRIFNGPALARTQDARCEAAPLPALPIEPVDGDDHFRTRPSLSPGQKVEEETGTLGMEVDDIDLSAL